MEQREQIISLYKKYGFEYRKASSTKEYLTFTYKSGFFHNAELVSFSNKDEEEINNKMDLVIQDLEKLGLSARAIA